MKSVLVTGSNGGIGSAICEKLKCNGYLVIGLDRDDDKNSLHGFIRTDICELVKSEEKRSDIANKLIDLIGESDLIGLVNNAAVQILSGIEELEIEDFRETIDTNLIAPLALCKLVFPYLKNNKGSIVNIGSIHSKLTKPRFISYATSKSGLLGLTQSLGVDCGEYIRVNAIEPAAIMTEMLKDGFEGNEKGLQKLNGCHPTNSIGNPKDVAECVYFLLKASSFLNGTVIALDGAISSRLFDPS